MNQEGYIQFIVIYNCLFNFCHDSPNQVYISGYWKAFHTEIEDFLFIGIKNW